MSISLLLSSKDVKKVCALLFKVIKLSSWPPPSFPPNSGPLGPGSHNIIAPKILPSFSTLSRFLFAVDPQTLQVVTLDASRSGAGSRGPSGKAGRLRYPHSAMALNLNKVSLRASFVGVGEILCFIQEFIVESYNFWWMEKITFWTISVKHFGFLFTQTTRLARKNIQHLEKGTSGFCFCILYWILRWENLKFHDGLLQFRFYNSFPSSLFQVTTESTRKVNLEPWRKLQFPRGDKLLLGGSPGPFLGSMALFNRHDFFVLGTLRFYIRIV